MHALFSTGSSILVGVFRCLVELDPNNDNNQQLNRATWAHMGPWAQPSPMGPGPRPGARGALGIIGAEGAPTCRRTAGGLKSLCAGSCATGCVGVGGWAR